MSQPHEHEEEDPVLQDEDIVEVYNEEDDDNVPMDEDDDDNAQYDGEIIIGGPGPGEEEEMMDMERHEDNSWGVTALHGAQQSIFTLSLHPLFPNPPIAVSGGEDDLGFIFSPIPAQSAGGVNSETFPPVRLTGHTDSVVAAGWSFDGEMVATGGMDGRVRVWKRVKARRGSQEVQAESADSWRDWEFLTNLETGSEIQWVTWHPKGNVLSAGCEDSSVWLWNLPSGNTLTVLSSHTLASTAGLFPPPTARQLLTSSLDSSLILWEISSSAPAFKSSIFTAAGNPELDPAQHGITSLAVAPNGQLAAVGGAGGRVRLVSLPKGDTVGRLEGHAERESVEALIFVDLLAGAGGGKGVVLVSAGTDGKGFVWDVATGRVRAELVHNEPITSLAAHPAPHLHLVTSASADGTLKTWDVRTGALVAEHKGHTGVVNGVAVASYPLQEGEEGKLGQVVVSAGDEGVSLIWRI
ncbi:WD40-repeat-containing domain protein [Naematelia encephala]|uniref:WD40-repeat-containing domain protein n=1 Tax=Naematelia encephala TaxID=71784 RepID=A0A1Y2BM41_9TREE|nr:WD40-repeat-containing domain protein [Naematelia encephala]